MSADDRFNPDALLYTGHQTAYPAYQRRRQFVELARRGRVVLRDDPDGIPPCAFGHERCSGGEAQ